MEDAELKSQIEAARAYQSLLVPSLFGAWSPRIADVIDTQMEQRHLDVACGTGSLAREIASRTGSGKHIAGVDPNPGMLAVATELDSEIEWKQGAAESLPFADNTFDSVACQFGLMFFTNQHQAIREMLRVLTPGGRLVVCVWDTLAHNPAYAASVQLLERVAGSPAAEALSAPFVLGNKQTLSELFTTAGAKPISISTQTDRASFPSISVMMQSDLRGWLPLLGVHLTDEVIDQILTEAEQVHDKHVDQEGRMVFNTSAHIVSALKPV